MDDLLQQHAQHYPKGTPPLDPEKICGLLDGLTDWKLINTNDAITKTFKFKNYSETINFVNKAAEVIHKEDHHPEMVVGYNTCRLVFSTHTVKGLSLNDFICATKIDKLYIK